ncbi:UNVERIFIED_ORG: glycosyltransferase [Roseateles sp. XES5]|nr:glycosyltransferase [Roseateles sp. XES5]
MNEKSRRSPFGVSFSFLSERKNILLLLRSSEFDPKWYRENYADLSLSNNALARHYLRYGAGEGRNPGKNFSTQAYLSAYPDVAESGVNPLIHYLRFGRDEGRFPFGEAFDPVFYKRLYPEAYEIGGSIAHHYGDVGSKKFFYSHFDEDWYRDEYADALDGWTESLQEHFFSVGRLQGFHPAFNIRWYRQEYPDVVRFGQILLDHYRAYGRKEGRHPAFDRRFYLEEYPDIAAAGFDPFAHYDERGRKEGRSPAFNRTWYKLTYSDVFSSGLEPYEHYCKIGRPEGRPSTGRDIWGALKWGRINPGTGNAKSWNLQGKAPETDPNYVPLVTIIVPNYNHEKYLTERLESVYGQTYRNFEVLLLDDASSDNSRAVLANYADRYPDVTSCVFNSVNSGGVFHQWKKGLDLAKGELVWIAESDDFCTPNFLEEMVRFFRNPGVNLAFARSDFITGEPHQKIWTSEEYWSEIAFSLGSSPTIVSAHEIVNRAWGARNLIANVSSALFRNPGKLDLLDDPVWQQLRICGDWILYLSLMRGGLVGYTPNATNFYRIHPSNTSIATHDKDVYFEEHSTVVSYLIRLFKVEDEIVRLHEEVLYRHWVMKRGHDRREEFIRLFDVERLLEGLQDRKPNIAMAVFALVTGGGETFPILLANQLFERGYAVTLINYAVEETNSGIRATLNPRIPLVEPENSAETAVILETLGIDLVHSHHFWVDMVIASSLKDAPHIRHVVTTHGQYELLGDKIKDEYEDALARVDAFVYIADKNLGGFRKALREEKSFTKITNTVALPPLSDINRAEFGIATDDFVVCLASRAVREKGWDEAVSAVIKANDEVSSRKVHLLLVGDGPEFERLGKSDLPPFIHLLGFQKNVRDFFAMADIGLLASRFKGESCPLVLIECLSVGNPMIASNIGEVPNMLAAPEGLAGIVVELDDWQIDVDGLARSIRHLADYSEAYETLKRRVPVAFEKFDQDTVLDRYTALYSQVLSGTFEKPRLSVVIVAYNMARELPRTIFTFSPQVQGIPAKDYEVIVIDNGSTCDYDVDELRRVCPNLIFKRLENAPPYPTDALNYGVSISSGEFVCACIDGARMASPNLLKAGLDACRADRRIVAGALSYHLGQIPQNDSVRDGYNQQKEDVLLQTIDWRRDGYELFRISSFDPSSRFGLYNMPAETNALFVSRNKWDACGGLDPAFVCRGGGLANLDIWRRLCEDEENVIVLLLGEGTFHQFHGGTATNAVEDVWTEFHNEYIRIRGFDYAVPIRSPLLKGKMHQAILDFALRS